MSALTNLRLYWHKRSLSNRLIGKTTSKESIDFEHAKTIGLLFHAADLQERQAALDFAKKMEKAGKKVRLLAFLDEEERNDNLPFAHFSKKEIDWAWRPNSPDVEQFVQYQMDILINLSIASSIIFEYITALTKARLRVGPVTENTDCYDLMIDVAGQNSLQHFIKQVEFLLNKTRHEEHSI